MFERIIIYYSKCLICAFLLAFPLLSDAQIGNVEFREKNFEGREAEFKKAFDHYKKGDYFFLRGPVYFPQALENYLVAQTFNPDNADLNFQIGLCYLNLQVDRLKSLPYLQRAQRLNPDLGNQFLLSLGKAYHYNMDFDQAIRVYNEFIETSGESADTLKIAQAKKYILECESGKELVKKPVRVRIDNLGPGVNSEFADYSPVINSDESKLIFTSRRIGTTGGMVDPIDSTFFEDIYITFKIDNEWLPAKNIGNPINEDEHDASINLSGDGKKLLIYRTKNGGDIYQSELNGIEWSEPEAIKEINTRDYENHATYSADGKNLFFISNREDEGSHGGKDIYIADISEAGKFSNVRNAGSAVNTDYDEDGVFFHPDGKTMYFSSMGFNSMGGFDIFKTEWDGSSFSEPENLGYPINSPEDDVFFVLTSDGRRAYFASYREEGYGDKDIYVMHFLDDMELLSSLQFKISDSTNVNKLAANIVIKDVATGEIVVNRNTEAGETIANLPAGKTYEITVSSDKYLPYTEVLEIPYDAGSQVVMRKIELGINPQVLVTGAFADLESKISLKGEVEFLDSQTGEVVKGSITDKSGQYNIMLPPGRDYLINVKSNGYALGIDTLIMEGIKKGAELQKNFSLTRLDRSRMSVLKGRIYDAVSGKDLKANIEITEYGGQPVIVYQKEGNYDCVVFNGALHTMVVNMEGYMTYTSQIHIPNEPTKFEITEDVALIKAEKGAKMVLNNIFFDFDKATLRPSSFRSLNTLLSMMKRYPEMSIEISGHTDNVGNMDYNQKLSDNRANVVKDYLVRNGISMKRIGAYGRAFRQPIASNDTNEGRQLNRRTEIKILRMK
jgi:outer membrane protein OmpA-like peptidoglycan-associated protein/tetratricopeptide (TPR) repeat protein